ncbi:MAG: hypothetical protein RLY86_2897 [Pseudomonadota bacterium]|jgi:hypothetical protein
MTVGTRVDAACDPAEIRPDPRWVKAWRAEFAGGQAGFRKGYPNGADVPYKRAATAGVDPE